MINIILYAIRIDGRYFKDYVHFDKKTIGRYSGHTALAGTLSEGDIIDVNLTNNIQRTEVARSIGNTISVLYGIEKLKNKMIEIIPIEG